MRSHILSVASALKLFLRDLPIQTNYVIILFATFFIFFIDLQLPLGIAAAVPFALVVFATLWVNSAQFTILISVLGVIFTLTKFFLTPVIITTMEAVIINRGLTLMLIICSAIMVLKLKKANIDISALTNQTLIDPTTGYKNRQAFETELETEIVRCKRYERNLSIAIIDIDLFKLFIDRPNHFSGSNNSIRTIAQEITANIRTSDIFYRIDINVFAISFPETDLAKAKEVCEAIRKKVSARMDAVNENKITISIGVAMLDNADSQISLCKRTEEALFMSKRNGGNLVTTIPEVPNKDKSQVAAILTRSRSD